MKNIFILLSLILFSCSTDSQESAKPQNSECYDIISKGYDTRGDYIIINYSPFLQKRYEVSNYQDYINQSLLCEPITLTQEPL